MATETVKQKILQVVERLPDSATLEDAIERLCFLANVEEGLRHRCGRDGSPRRGHSSDLQVISSLLPLDGSLIPARQKFALPAPPAHLCQPMAPDQGNQSPSPPKFNRI